MPTGIFPRPSLKTRFEAKIAPGRCPQEWQGSCDSAGYGRITVEGKPRLVHRIRWELDNGPIPNGLYVCHHCDNPPCVTIAHLFLGTNSDNQLDASAKGRKRNGNETKTHCPRNHPLFGDNLYTFPDGRRTCRICMREAWRRNHPPRSRKASRTRSKNGNGKSK